MVNFGPPNTVPEKFKDRKFYQHNPTVTLMRTTVEENRKLGEEIGRNAAAATGSVDSLLGRKHPASVVGAASFWCSNSAKCGRVEVVGPNDVLGTTTYCQDIYDVVFDSKNGTISWS